MQQPEWPSEDFPSGADSSKSRGKFGIDFCNGSGDLLFFFAALAEIAGGLNVEPELRALFKKFAQFQGHLGRDTSAAKHDFVDAAGADAEGAGQCVLGNAHGHEVVFEQNFPGSNRVHSSSLHRRICCVEIGEQCQALFRRTTRCHRSEAGFGTGSANVLVGRSVRR